jgi:hypothetical protein
MELMACLNYETVDMVSVKIRQKKHSKLTLEKKNFQFFK